jgi:hypothetical protein
LYVCDGDGFYDDDPSCLMFVFNRGCDCLNTSYTTFFLNVSTFEQGNCV